jgi:hypothetical protein
MVRRAKVASAEAYVQHLQSEDLSRSSQAAWFGERVNSSALSVNGAEFLVATHWASIEAT